MILTVILKKILLALHPTNTGNPFKEIQKTIKNSALFLNGFYLNERGITLFNEYRLEYLKL